MAEASTEGLEPREPALQKAIEEIKRQFVPEHYMQVADRVGYLSDRAPDPGMKEFMKWAQDQFPLIYLAAKKCEPFAGAFAWFMGYMLGSYVTGIKKDVWPVSPDLKALLIDALGDLGGAMEDIMREYGRQCSCSPGG